MIFAKYQENKTREISVFAENMEIEHF